MTEPEPVAVAPAETETLIDQVPPPSGDAPPPEADTPDELTEAIALSGELNETENEVPPPCWTDTVDGQLVIAASAEGEWATSVATIPATRRNAITRG